MELPAELADAKIVKVSMLKRMLKLNNYLGSNINVNENTNETITIRLIDDDEEAEDE